MISKKHLTTLTGLVLAASFALTGCAAGGHSDPQQAGSIATANPNGNHYPVGEAIFDGTDFFALATLPDDDPSFTWQPTLVDKATLAPGAFTQQDVIDAQKVAENYINEAIQAPPIFDTPDPVLAAYEHRVVSKYFHSGYKFDETGEKLPQTYDNQYGNSLYVNEGRHLLGAFLNYDNDARSSAAFGYDYGKDKERLVSRTFTLKRAGLNQSTTSNLGDFNKLHKDKDVEVGKTIGFEIQVDFTSKSLLSGQPVIDAGTGTFNISLAKENGKFVIVSTSNNSYTHY